MTSALVWYYGIGGVAACIVAAGTAVLALRRGWMIPHAYLVIAIAVVPVLVLMQSVLKFASLHMYADVAHWLQLLHGIITTGTPHILSHTFLVPGTSNYFSVHFVPLLYLFAVPFALLPYPQTIMVLHVALMVSAVVPLYLLARHRTGDRRFALSVAALLLWYPTFQYITIYEFEMLRFSIPVLLWMLYAWEKRRMGWYYVCVLLAILVREEVGLTVGMFGVFLMLVRREWRHGFVTALVGFGAFGVIASVIMPAFRSGAYAHVAWGAYGAFGRTPLEVVMGVLVHPLRALAAILDPMKLANVGMLFLPLLFLPLLAPAALLPMLPTLGIGLLSSVPTHSSYMLYYVAPAIPFVFFAFVTAWPRIVAWFVQHVRGCVGADAQRRASSAAMVTLGVGVLVVSIVFGPSPLALQFWSDRFRPAPFRTQSFHWSAYWVTAHHLAIRDVIAMIPGDAIVATQQFLMPRLAHVRGTMVYPQIVSGDGAYRATYVLFDTTHNGLRVESPAFVADTELAIVRASDQWVRIYARNSYELYQLRE